MWKIWYVINISFAIVLLICVSVFAAQYYAVPNWSTVTVNEWSTCKSVTNNCWPQIFVPTNTAAEWTNFINYKPACVTLGTCGYYYTIAAYWNCATTWGTYVSSHYTWNTRIWDNWCWWWTNCSTAVWDFSSPPTCSYMIDSWDSTCASCMPSYPYAAVCTASTESYRTCWHP